MFTANDMSALLKAKPFVPFRLVLSDGSAVKIRSPEVAIVGGRFALVGLLDPDATDRLVDCWTVVWYMHVTRTEQISPGAAPFTTPGTPDSPAPSPA